jgi:peptidoglycan/LPS O-acetylase OafA/YrhL
MTTQRVTGLDGIRGVAIVLVLVAHLLGLNGAGLVGVLVFFVLSGYLITTLLLRESVVVGRVDLPHFYLRRALRLVPALVLLLAVVGVLSFVPGTGITPADAARGAVQGLLYITDFTVGLQLNFVPALAHLWTLAVEEQFYLLWPLALVVIARRTAPESRLRVMGWLLGAGMLLRVLTILAAGRLDLFFYALPTTWVDTLLVGCTLAVVLHGDPARAAKVRRVAGHPVVGAVAWGLILALGLHPATFTHPLTYVLGIPLLALAAARLAVAATQEPVGPTRRLLQTQVLGWFGDHSYGIYLFNSTCVIVLTNLLGPGLATRSLGIAVAIGAAALSRRFVERPFLTLKERIARPRPVVAP